jgi:hypothetical protein
VILRRVISIGRPLASIRSVLAGASPGPQQFDQKLDLEPVR